MAHSRESSTWTEILIVLLIVTILGAAMYFSIRNQPTHTNKSTMVSAPNTEEETSSETKSASPIKTSSKAMAAITSQKAIHTVPITFTTAPKAIHYNATGVIRIKRMELTPVIRPSKNRARRWGKNLKGIDLMSVRVPRPIRRIPEVKG